MPDIQMRFSGGPMHAKAIWVDDQRVSLEVHMNDPTTQGTRTLLYRREQGVFVFEGETNTLLTAPGAHPIIPHVNDGALNGLRARPRGAAPDG